MFTLHVSWLLVACIPGLLMLTALGLGRLELQLAHDTDKTAPLEDADAVNVHTLAREGMPEALEYLHWRQDQRLSHSPPAGIHAGARHARPEFAVEFAERDRQRFPTLMRTHPGVNPQFEGTRHANRV